MSSTSDAGEVAEVVDPAASASAVVLHKFRKSVQPALCSHCNLAVFTGVQCTECRVMCHKACVEKARRRTHILRLRSRAGRRRRPVDRGPTARH